MYNNIEIIYSRIIIFHVNLSNNHLFLYFVIDIIYVQIRKFVIFKNVGTNFLSYKIISRYMLDAQLKSTIYNHCFPKCAMCLFGENVLSPV